MSRLQLRGYGGLVGYRCRHRCCCRGGRVCLTAAGSGGSGQCVNSSAATRTRTVRRTRSACVSITGGSGGSNGRFNSAQAIPAAAAADADGEAAAATAAIETTTTAGAKDETCGSYRTIVEGIVVLLLLGAQAGHSRCGSHTNGLTSDRGNSPSSSNSTTGGNGCGDEGGISCEESGGQESRGREGGGARGDLRVLRAAAGSDCRTAAKRAAHVTP